MSAVPDELARARRDEIVNACAELYETMSFRDITLKEIGQRTSFTRTSIYNYFQTREEIFLALFQREYEDWTHDLLLLRCSHEAMTAEEFACALAETLARRERLRAADGAAAGRADLLLRADRLHRKRHLRRRRGPGHDREDHGALHGGS